MWDGFGGSFEKEIMKKERRDEGIKETRTERKKERRKEGKKERNN